MNISTTHMILAIIIIVIIVGVIVMLVKNKKNPPPNDYAEEEDVNETENFSQTDQAVQSGFSPFHASMDIGNPYITRTNEKLIPGREKKDKLQAEYGNDIPIPMAVDPIKEHIRKKALEGGKSTISRVQV